LDARFSPTAVTNNHSQSCVSYGKHTQYVTVILKSKLDSKCNKGQTRRTEMLFWKI
jgi:hypothetical protein